MRSLTASIRSCSRRKTPDSNCIPWGVVVVVYGHVASATWLFACSGNRYTGVYTAGIYQSHSAYGPLEPLLLIRLKFDLIEIHSLYLWNIRIPFKLSADFLLKLSYV